MVWLYFTHSLHKWGLGKIPVLNHLNPTQWLYVGLPICDPHPNGSHLYITLLFVRFTHLVPTSPNYNPFEANMDLLACYWKWCQGHKHTAGTSVTSIHTLSESQCAELLWVIQDVFMVQPEETWIRQKRQWVMWMKLMIEPTYNSGQSQILQKRKQAPTSVLTIHKCFSNSFCKLLLQLSTFFIWNLFAVTGVTWSFFFYVCFVGKKRFECPMCSVVCSDSFSLQEHVELHLDHGAAANSAGGHIFIPPYYIIHSVPSIAH